VVSVLKSRVSSSTPHNVKLIAGALLQQFVVIQYRTRSKHVPLEAAVVVSGSLAFWQPENIHIQGQLARIKMLSYENPRSKINSNFYQRGRIGASATRFPLLK
jgi:hypothetical protein